MATLLLFGLKSSIFKAEFYQKSLKRAHLYDQLADNLLPTFLSGGGQGQGMPPEAQAELVGAIKEAIPQTWFDEQIKMVSDGIFNYIKGDTNEVKANIVLTQAKQTLAAKLSSGALGANSQELNQGLAGIPDQFDLGAMITKNGALSPARQAYQIGNLVAWVCLALAVLFWLIIGLINLFYPPGMMKWLSIPVMAVSTVFFLVMVGLKIAVSYFAAQALVSGMDANLRPLAEDGLKYLIYPIFNVFLWEAGIIFILSLLTLIAAIILTRKFPKKPEPVQNKPAK